MADAPSETGTDTDYVSKSELANIVNQAVTSQLKRSLGKTLSDAIEAAVAPIREQLTAREAEPEKPAKKDAARDASPEVATLQAELKKLQDKLGAETKARKDTSRKAAEERAYNSLVSELTSSGKLRPEGVSVAADLLRARGVLRVDDDGSHAYRHDDQDLTLSEGVGHFLKSKEAALFMAPPAAKAPATNKPAFLPAPRAGGQGTADKPQGTPEERAAARLAERGIDLKSALG